MGRYCHIFASRLDFRNDEDSNEYACELALVKHRAKALELVMGTDTVGLAEYLKKYGNSDGRSSTNYEGADALDLSRETTAASLVAAPPCLGAQNLLCIGDLQTLTTLQGLTGKVDAPTDTKQSLSSYEEKVSKHLSALAELLKSVKSATADLHEARVVKLSEAAKLKRAREAEAARQDRTLAGKKMKAERGKAPAQADSRSVFEARSGDLPPIRVVSEEAFASYSAEDLLEPCIIRPAKTMTALRQADASLRKEIADNKAKFSHDLNRAKGLRNIVVDDSVRSVLKTTLRNLIPKAVRQSFVDTDKEAIKQSFEPDFWMRMANTVSGGPEKLYLPAVGSAPAVSDNDRLTCICAGRVGMVCM